MPGRLFLTTPAAEIARLLGADAAAVGGEPPRRNIAPGQDVLVCPPDRRLVRMRWGIVPVGRVNARGRPVMETIVNARGETLFAKSAFAGVGRAVVPADGWYEWTGAARRKRAWRLSRKDGAPLFFAAICDVWRAPGGTEVHQVATVTCAPNADVAPVHHRMGVLLTAEQAADWLDAREAEAAALLVPLPDGLLRVDPADDVDWTAP